MTLQFLKIACEQILPTYDISNYLSIHARKSYSSLSGAERVHYYSPKNRHYFPLKHDIISELDIAIRDNYNTTDTRSFQAGHSTIVVLHFKKMDLPLNYTVRVTNWSKHEKQKTCNFTVKLPEKLSLSAQGRRFEVGLTSITFDQRLKPLIKQKNYVEL